MATKSQIEASKRYLENWEDIKIRVKKGTRAKYKQAAKINDKSFNSYVIELIDEDIKTNPKTAHLLEDLK